MRIFLVSLLMVLVTAVMPAAPAQATPLKNKYIQHCTLANTGQVDPLVSPGQVADHEHAEFGAVNWGTSTTTADMLNGPTTCTNTSNHAAYWTPPIVLPDGTVVYPNKAGGYYQTSGADPDLLPAHIGVQPYPVGMRFLVGNSHSTVLQRTNVVVWSCSKGNTFYTPPGVNVPTSCPADAVINETFKGPECWDGMNLDSADHRSHITYAPKTATGNVGPGCPATHPIRVPSLAWTFNYPPEAAGGCPASDHGIGPCGRTSHMDLWEAQDPMAQATLTACLNDGTRNDDTIVDCGQFTTNDGNGLMASVFAWAYHVSYADQFGKPLPPPS